ncbi:hypothetical protein BKA62DRAFT_378570 [Auriculariales sp. MPI-PUGE-AT-0066]|nr:hypothetical protein BKA62DRAFT_378570 [Auriculariales sp. MPI-PUGE-AT-0066]
MASTITLYDIESTAKSWSPNVLRIRYALNYKGLKYHTHWLKFPEIAGHAKSIGAKPTAKLPDGTGDWYTCPIIEVTLPGETKPTVISDSGSIAEFLDTHAAFNTADTPKLFPPGTRALQESFLASLDGTLVTPPVLYLTQAGLLERLVDDASIKYLTETRTKWFGGLTSWFGDRAKHHNLAPAEWVPAGSPEREAAWKGIQDSWSKVAQTYKVAQKDGGGPWLTGSKPVYADFMVLGFVGFVQSTVSEEEFAKVLEWDDGVWKTLWDASVQLRAQID